MRRWRGPISDVNFTSSVRSIIETDTLENLFEICVDSFGKLGLTEFVVGGFDRVTRRAMPCDWIKTFDVLALPSLRRKITTRDPVMERTLTSATVVPWDRDSLEREAPGSRFLDFVRDLKLQAGLNMPLQERGNEVWGMVVASRSPRVFSPEQIRQAFSLSAMVLLKRTLLLAACAARTVDDPRIALLSEEQREILRWVAEGKSNADIALIMDRTKRAVDYHVAQILRKLGVATRTQAAALLAT